MSDNNQLTDSQLINLVIIFLLGTYIIVGSRTLIGTGTGAWTALILAVFPGILLAFILQALQKRFPGKTLVQYNEIILGKFLGNFLNLVYILYFIMLFNLISNNLAFIFTTIFYVQTPVWVFIFTMFIMSVSLVLGGLTTVGRMSEIATPFLIILIAITTFLALASPTTSITNLFPLFSEGIKPILQSAWFTFAFPFGETIVFVMFLPYVKGQQKLAQNMIIGMIIGGFILLMTIIRNLLVMGSSMLQNSNYSSAHVTRLIELGGFIERVEIIIIVGWVFSIFMKGSIALLASGLAISQTFGLKNKNLIWPAILLITLIINHFLIGDQFTVIEINKKIYPYMVILQLFIPILLLLIAKLRGLKIKNQATAQKRTG